MMPKQFLRADRLLPGDVILSRGDGKESNWIAWASFGRFSHAAIYMHSFCVFESNDGVGFAPRAFPVARVGFDRARLTLTDATSRQELVLLDASDRKALEVRRHPDLYPRLTTQNEPPDLNERLAVFEALAECLVPMAGLDYPPLSNLARASPLPHWLMLPVLRLAARGQEPVQLPGRFCSEVVTTALREAGADPIRKPFWRAPWKPSEVSPNTLARRWVTNLEPVNDVIVDESFPLFDQDANHLETCERLQKEIFASVTAKVARQWQETVALAVDNRERMVKTSDQLRALARLARDYFRSRRPPNGG